MRKKNFDVKVSPVNWYVAGILLRIAIGEINENNENRRCDAWENYILIKGENSESAYNKALEFGKLGESEYLNPDRERVKFTFEGLTTLVPIYEELEDGSELIWREYENRTVKKIKS